MTLPNLSRREIILACAVGGILFLVANLFLLRGLAFRIASAKEAIRTRQSELDVLRALYAQREVWSSRSAWIDATQPTTANPDEAGVQLLETVRQAARKYGVILENPALASPEQTPSRFAVSVSAETVSPWPALVDFMREMQAPERFIVFDTATLKVDPQDKSRIRGKFRITRWYAPRQPK